MIAIKVKNAIKLLNDKNIDSNPELLGILNTMFHESRHIEQFKFMDSDQMNQARYL